ncbi:hypothetical protein AAFF_G00061890 [Aldrovandia affinis]|uniref:Uncharacterized protein n=1 Tax=Aldrovandia affinis TaxID=143900 RepID=A0AAD7RZV7_9TELE|nr:hypothetical protein AAFF_G00061890 [Aldrovandia affinis]
MVSSGFMWTLQRGRHFFLVTHTTFECKKQKKGERLDMLASKIAQMLDHNSIQPHTNIRPRSRAACWNNIDLILIPSCMLICVGPLFPLVNDGRKLQAWNRKCKEICHFLKEKICRSYENRIDILTICEEYWQLDQPHF